MSINRHQRILALLNDEDFLAAGDLARLFNVTPMTVWRDFKALEELGLVRRVRGGVRPVAARGEQPLESRTEASWEPKQRIAALAVREFVNEGDVVVLGGGTSVAAVIPYLPASHLSILTNSVPAALQVRAVRPDLSVRVVGGWLNSVSGNLVGTETLREVRHLTADICFVGATSFDAEVGPSDPNPMEIEVTRAWSSICLRTVMLLDAGKFGRRSAAVTIHPRRLHALVTDKTPPASIVTLLRAHSVQLHIPRP